MSICSLKYVNDAECHSTIVKRSCPGFVSGHCENETALAALAVKRRIQGRIENRSCGCAHVIDQSDLVTIEPTKRNIEIFIKAVKRRSLQNA